jgi:hypothetical protein
LIWNPEHAPSAAPVHFIVGLLSMLKPLLRITQHDDLNDVYRLIDSVGNLESFAASYRKTAKTIREHKAELIADDEKLTRFIHDALMLSNFLRDIGDAKLLDCIERVE